MGAIVRGWVAVRVHPFRLQGTRPNDSTTMAEYQGLRDRATQAVAEGRFEEAERIYTCAFARAEQRAVDYGYTLTILHDFVSFYDRYVTHLLKEQRFVFQQRPRDRDNMRRHGQARKRLYRAQLACYQRILNLQEQVLGPDHLQVSDTLLAMAHLHWDHFN